MFARVVRFIKKLFSKPEATPTKPIVVKPVEIPQNRQNIDTDFQFSDSSHHHPGFDVTKYTAPLFINKTTEGVSFVDKTHALRKEICGMNGILYGGYHFFKTDRDWKQQMIFYIETHGSFVIPPIIDYETTKGQEESDLMKHKSELLLALWFLKKETGKTPIIYLNYSASKRLRFAPEFGEYYAWFARYNSFMGPIPAPWTEKTCFAWQFTESGEFPGLAKPGDVNIYYAKSKALDA